MKLEVLVANEEALKTLVETKFDDAQLAWDLAESFDEVEKAITKFQKMRDEYVKANGKPSEESPDRFTIPDPEAFSKEMQKLLAVEVDIVFPAFAISKLPEIDSKSGCPVIVLLSVRMPCPSVTSRGRPSRS